MQAFAVASRTLGGCATPGSYIAGGRVISGLGDQAAGVMVKVVDGEDTRHTPWCSAGPAGCSTWWM